MSSQERDKRIPSFNDFSPGILRDDIRLPLQIIVDAKGDRGKAIEKFALEFFDGSENKRSKTNIPATLTSTGLVSRDSFLLTDFGHDVLKQKSPQLAAKIFVKGIVLKRNGLFLLDAIRRIYDRRDTGSRKDLLKRELTNLGIEGLANATTDHTTLENWMIVAGIVEKDGRLRKINDTELRKLIGADGDDIAAMLSLEPGHRLFLKIVRRITETEGKEIKIPLRTVYDECLRTAKSWFDEDQLRKKVVNFLQHQGWIEASIASSGKGGSVMATERLLRVPLNDILPHVFGSIPSDIRSYLSLPLSEIMDLLNDAVNKNNRGIGLELLALRIILDLSLEPRGFRARAKDTGYAEVDLLAEGRNLLYTRWVIQCKNLESASKVQLSDVAKEVGIAIYKKAHVVVVITTSEFTKEARKYAEEITRETHLQCVLVPGDAVSSYLTGGESKIVDFFMSNASRVMLMKRDQSAATDGDEHSTAQV